MIPQQATDITIRLCSLRHDASLETLTVQGDDVGLLVDTIATNAVAAWALWRIKTDYNQPGLDELRRALTRYATVGAVKCERCKKIFLDLSDALDKQGVKMVAIKGVAMMLAYYPEVSMRPVGDIDVYVDLADVDKARSILQSIPGISKCLQSRSAIALGAVHKDEPYKIGKILMEMHVRLYRYSTRLNPIGDISRHIVTIENAQGRRFRLFDSPLMLYHLTVHFITSRSLKRARLGWLIDLVMIWNAEGDKALDVCREALSINPLEQKRIIAVWQRALGLLPEDRAQWLASGLGCEVLPFEPDFFETGFDGYKMSSIGEKIRFALILLKTTVSMVKKEKGIKAKIKIFNDIIYDIKNRNKWK